MRCDLSESSNSGMSSKSGSVKLRILILVVKTANLINERATPTLGISRALIAPTAIFTTYLFIGTFVIGAVYKHYASTFLQMYALLACCTVEISLSLTVFDELKSHNIHIENAAPVLNGVLPMICSILLLVDLIGIIFEHRHLIGLPSTGSRSRSHLDIQQRNQ